MFQIGDIVESHGVIGKIESINDPESDCYPIVVVFDQDGIINISYYDLNGKSEAWHKEPSLKLIERPKKKVTGSFDGYFFEGGQGHKVILNGNIKLSDYMYIIESNTYKKVKVTYEYEE